MKQEESTRISFDLGPRGSKSGRPRRATDLAAVLPQEEMDELKSKIEQLQLRVAEWKEAVDRE